MHLEESESAIDITVTKRLRNVFKSCKFPIKFPLCFVSSSEIVGQQELFDIDIDENGDIAHESSFDTALKMTLFCERRASASEQVVPERRRGWIGNEANEIGNFEIGSKLWLLFQARLTQTEVNAAVDYTNQALEWMVEDNLLKSVEVVGSKENGALLLNIILFRFNDRVDSRLFKIWNNTGVLENVN